MTSGSRLHLGRVPSAIRRPKSSTVTRSASDMTMPMSCSTRTTEMPSATGSRGWLPPSGGSPRRSCRPPVRRAGAAAAPCRAPARPRPASGRRRTGRRRACAACSRVRGTRRSRPRARRALALARRLRQPQPGRDEAGLRQVVAAEHEVLGHGLAGRQGDVLERARHADPGDLERPHLVEPVLTEPDLAPAPCRRPTGR